MQLFILCIYYRVKIKEINTQNKQLHPLVTLLQYVQKMHGMNNLIIISRYCFAKVLINGQISGELMTSPL